MIRVNRSCEDRGRGREKRRLEDAALLALQTEEGDREPKVAGASGSWKGQGDGFSLEPLGRT